MKERKEERKKTRKRQTRKEIKKEKKAIKVMWYVHSPCVIIWQSCIN